MTKGEGTNYAGFCLIGQFYNSGKGECNYKICILSTLMHIINMSTKHIYVYVHAWCEWKLHNKTK